MTIMHSIVPRYALRFGTKRYGNYAALLEIAFRHLFVGIQWFVGECSGSLADENATYMLLCVCFIEQLFPCEWPYQRPVILRKFVQSAQIIKLGGNVVKNIIFALLDFCSGKEHFFAQTYVQAFLNSVGYFSIFQ